MLRILEINKLTANALFVASVFNDSLKISKFYNDLYGKPLKRAWVARVFSHTNPSNF